MRRGFAAMVVLAMVAVAALLLARGCGDEEPSAASVSTTAVRPAATGDTAPRRIRAQPTSVTGERAQTAEPLFVDGWPAADVIVRRADGSPAGDIPFQDSAVGLASTRVRLFALRSARSNCVRIRAGVSLTRCHRPRVPHPSAMSVRCAAGSDQPVLRMGGPAARPRPARAPRHACRAEFFLPGPRHTVPEGTSRRLSRAVDGDRRRAPCRVDVCSGWTGGCSADDPFLAPHAAAASDPPAG